MCLHLYVHYVSTVVDITNVSTYMSTAVCSPAAAPLLQIVATQHISKILTAPFSSDHSNSSPADLLFRNQPRTYVELI